MSSHSYPTGSPVTMQNNIDSRYIENIIYEDILGYFLRPARFKERMSNKNINRWFVPVWMMEGTAYASCSDHKTIQTNETVDGKQIKEPKTIPIHKNITKKINWAIAAHDPKTIELRGIKDAISDFSQEKLEIGIDTGDSLYIKFLEFVRPKKKFYRKNNVVIRTKPNSLGNGNSLLLPSNSVNIQGRKNTGIPALRQEMDLEQAKNHLDANLRMKLKKALHGPGEIITKEDIYIEADNSRLIFIPLWVLSYDYEGKTFHGVINGFNGIPIRILIPKSFRAWSIAFIVFNALIYLIWTPLCFALFKYDLFTLPLLFIFLIPLVFFLSVEVMMKLASSN